MSVKPTFEHTDSFRFALKKNFKMLFKRNFFIKNKDWKFTSCVVCVEISWLITASLFLFIETELDVNDVEIVVWDRRMSKVRNICI